MARVKMEVEELLFEYLKRDPTPHIRNELYPVLRELGVEKPEDIVPRVLVKMEREGKVILEENLYPAFEHPLRRGIMIGRVRAKKIPRLRPGYIYSMRELVEELAELEAERKKVKEEKSTLSGIGRITKGK